MEFYNYLLEQFGYNEVIFSNEISFNDYSEPWIKKAVARLCEEERLIRFDKGVYYIPTNAILGKSKLDPRKVITKKYVKNNNETVGYFAGITFLNILGLSTQMPNTIEIYTNNESARVREVSVGQLKVLLRRSRANISSRNAATMSFLELINSTDAVFYDDRKRQTVAEFIKKNSITRQMVSECSPYFPDKAMRTMVESEVVYNFAQR